MKSTFMGVALAIALGVAQSGQAVFAQSTDNQPDQMQMMNSRCSMMGMMGMMGRRGMGRGMHGRMDQKITDRMDQLRTELGISEEQKEAWTGYADAVEFQFEAMRANHQVMMQSEPADSAVKRLEHRIAMMETMVAGMTEIKTALESLYELLDENQKMKIDNSTGFGCRP